MKGAFPILVIGEFHSLNGTSKKDNADKIFLY